MNNKQNKLLMAGRVFQPRGVMDKAQAFGLSSAGIAGLFEAIEQEKEREAIRDGELIFWLTISGEANEAKLSGLVSQDSLTQLILFTLEHRAKITAAFNTQKSADLRAERKASNEKLVLGWCDANPQKARLKYEHIVAEAAEELGITASTSVRQGIALWRKRNR